MSSGKEKESYVYIHNDLFAIFYGFMFSFVQLFFSSSIMKEKKEEERKKEMRVTGLRHKISY